MQLTLASCRIEQIICTTQINKRVSSKDHNLLMCLFLEPILWFYSSSPSFSSYPTLILRERYHCSSFLPFEIILKAELHLFSICLNTCIIQHSIVSLINLKLNLFRINFVHQYESLIFVHIVQFDVQVSCAMCQSIFLTSFLLIDTCVYESSLVISSFSQTIFA